MTHSFDVEIANELGIEKAIIIQNLIFWINKNIANKVNIHDGKTYTYNSYEAFAELFPYMKLNTIKRVIRELENDGYIESRNDLNSTSYDKTKWYCICDTPLLKNLTTHSYKNNHQGSEKQPSIVDTDNKPNNKPIAKDVINAYAENVSSLYDKIKEMKSINEMVLNHKLSFDLIIVGIINYGIFTKRENIEIQYIKSLINFVKDKTYMDWQETEKPKVRRYV